jgi:hypothetical protein
MKVPPFAFHGDKKLGLLALLAALCLSPVTVAYLFTADGQLPAPSLRLALWLLTLGLVLFGLAAIFTKLPVPVFLRKLLLFILFGFIPFYASVLLDRALGYLFLPTAQNFVFTPNTSAVYQNPEFTVVTRINHLGFRDFDYPLDKKNKFRILVLGSSFTFGWGVDLPDTWVKQVEKKLQARQVPVEVLNLGRIGSSPQAYRLIAEKAIPALKPDLVVVSLLQGTELLSEVMEEPAIRQPGAQLMSFRSYLEILRANTYPNLLRLFSRAARETQIKAVWQSQAGDILQHLTKTQRTRFQKLPSLVQDRFRQGNLNPDLVYSFLKHPDLFLQLEQAKPPVMEKGVRQISGYLRQIKEVAARNGASCVLLQIPNKFYLCPQTMGEHLALGARIDPSLLRRNTADSLLQATARRTGLPLLQVSPGFKDHCGTQRLYYTYDSHMTPLGHKLFAREVFEKLKGYVPGAAR